MRQVFIDDEGKVRDWRPELLDGFVVTIDFPYQLVVMERPPCPRWRLWYYEQVEARWFRARYRVARWLRRALFWE